MKQISVNILVGNCMNVLGTLPGESVPIAAQWRGVLGLEPTYMLYIEHMVAVFCEVWRVLRKDGTPIRARARAAGKVGWHCEHVSEGCRNCYAEGMNRRLGTGIGYKPGSRDKVDILVTSDFPRLSKPVTDENHAWPLPNLWLGVSVEDQRRADERIPDLLATPAAVRFISAEPLLGPIDLTRIDCVIGSNSGVKNALTGNFWIQGCGSISSQTLRGGSRIDQVIVGGESGPHARPMAEEWAVSILNQCRSAGVAFFMKQMGGVRKPFAQIPNDLMVRQHPEALG